MSTLACLLCGFFLDGGLAVHRAIDPAPPLTTEITFGNAGTWRHETPGAWAYDINKTRNPYGVLALGYEHEVSAQVRVSLQLRHESSIAMNDHGTNSAQLTLRWKPWGQR